MLDNAVFHAQALHILAANIKDELNAWQHFLGTAQMRDRLDFARINAQRFQQQTFAVASHRGMTDGYQLFSLLIAWKERVQLIERCTSAAQNVAFVAYVTRPQNTPLVVDKHRLERGGAGVQTQIRNAAIIRQVRTRNAFLIVTRLELRVICLVGKQRGQANNFASLNVA